MIERYWTDIPDWHVRRFVIANNGVIRAEKFISCERLEEQPDDASRLALMAAIEAQAESELKS